MARKSLGEFEHRVLLTLLRLGGESYSVPVVLELESCTGREVAQAAVFIALQRLEKKGLVASRLEASSGTGTGRPRRYFRPTPAALAKLRESRRVLTRLWDGLEARLEEA